ncbi:MAG TPA: hypothetical protein DFS52_05725 [Myxococcales bacterium]|nr:hypothetical protein [Myxococcales bacterium]
MLALRPKHATEGATLRESIRQAAALADSSQELLARDRPRARGLSGNHRALGSPPPVTSSKVERPERSLPRNEGGGVKGSTSACREPAERGSG